MEEYSSTTLDRDCAFDINSICELLEQGKSVLNNAISISRQMENSISHILGAYGRIDAQYKVIDYQSAGNRI